MHAAFVASTELRPMAQQLATMRTDVAYAAVTKYARTHTGEAASAAYLALGHAYLLDRKFADAAAAFAESRKNGTALSEYAEFLGAEAEHGAGNEQAAERLLNGFKARYPDSVFLAQVPELEAAVLLAEQKPDAAAAVLAANKNFDSRVAFQLALGEVEMAKGEKQSAMRDLKHLVITHPGAHESDEARAKLLEMGADFTVDERRELGDAFYNAKKYSDAVEQYRFLAHNTALSETVRNEFAVAEAASNLKLKRLTLGEAEALKATDDENGARRLYLLMELARGRTDLEAQRKTVAELKEKFPHSQWLAEALFSSGNMYLLRKEYTEAVANYSYLSEHFPENKNASPANWRAGWLTYRMGKFDDAATLFDRQIEHFPTAKETVGAVYWRARLYETKEHNTEKAVADYRTVSHRFPHFFYAQMSRQRLAALGNKVVEYTDTTDDAPEPDGTPAIAFDTDLPESPHLEKASLLANAGLNDYIALEIAAVPGSSGWSGLAEARIYESYGETYLALRAIKRAMPNAMSTEISKIPLEYWRILFPEPWWETVKSESAKKGLDPYMVLSLIRQESEFNPSVISHANAYGLMQLLPSVGKQMAKEEGIENFQTNQLLDPEMNIRLGTRYLKQLLDQFNGVPEYALAAYNAGEGRVADWLAAGPYSGLDEYVESIPFTETREYVQAIDRNREIYKAIETYAATTKKAEVAQGEK
jgi:soluble lytic murein transglycosylase